MILEGYDTFRSIGIDDDTARKAAGALSDTPNAIFGLRSDMKDEFATVRSEFTDLPKISSAATRAVAAAGVAGA